MRKNKYIFGLIIIGIGALLLIQNLGIAIGINLNIGTVIRLLVPLFLLYHGIKKMISGRHVIFGAILAFIGFNTSLSALSSIFWFLHIPHAITLPVTLIIIGTILIIKPSHTTEQQDYDFKHATRRSYNKPRTHFRDFEDSNTTNWDNVCTYKSQHDAIVEKKETNSEPSQKNDKNRTKADADQATSYKRHFQTTFNSRNVTLNENDFLKGDNHIEINCTMGEFKLALPKTVNIILDGRISLGEIKFIKKSYDGLSQIARVKYSAPGTPNKTIKITATVSLGEIQINLI